VSREVTLDNAQAYKGDGSRWYGAVYAWRTEDIPFYLRLAREHAGPGGSVLEVAAGEGRVALPMLREGFRVTALDSSADMLETLRLRAAAEDDVTRERLETVRQDMRKFQLDRLYRLIYLPFNSLLVMAQPHERYSLLTRVREHLAPSGAFAFDVFTPDPELMHDEPEWAVDLEHEAEDPLGEGTVHVLRERQRAFDFGKQVMHVDWRTAVRRNGEMVATWETQMDLAYIFPRELELLLERQGFRIKNRYGGPGREPYEPDADDVQPQYVVAQLAP
jgi:SAM-dependent methyltransferase